MQEEIQYKWKFTTKADYTSIHKCTRVLSVIVLSPTKVDHTSTSIQEYQLSPTKADYPSSRSLFITHCIVLWNFLVELLHRSVPESDNRNNYSVPIQDWVVIPRLGQWPWWDLLPPPSTLRWMAPPFKALQPPWTMRLPNSCHLTWQNWYIGKPSSSRQIFWAPLESAVIWCYMKRSLRSDISENKQSDLCN